MKTLILAMLISVSAFAEYFPQSDRAIRDMQYQNQQNEYRWQMQQQQNSLDNMQQQLNQMQQQQQYNQYNPQLNINPNGFIR